MEVNAYKVVVGNPDGKKQLGEDGRILSSCVFKEVERKKFV
jgi:hypothetical protein